MFRITQWFGENPDYYGQFGLPGHEGIDFRAPHGQDIFAVLSGTVYRVENDPNSGNYGIHVRIQHEGELKTIYAHLDRALVQVGDVVVGGQKIGEADNTGNSYGSHLHMSEKETGVNYIDEEGTVWPYNMRDPWHHLEPVYAEWLDENGTTGYLWADSLILNMQETYARAYGSLNLREEPSSSSTLLATVEGSSVVRITGEPINGYYPVFTPYDDTPVGVRRDLEPYLRGTGVLYEVRNTSGSQERFQTQTKENGIFWQTKNSLAEQLRVSDTYIYRGWDTSPGNGRFYIQQQYGQNEARWLPRYMYPGEEFTVSLYVQFYNWDCTESDDNSGDVRNTMRFVDHLDTWTSPFGITLDDVVVIQWVNGGEYYYYARGFGLVAWGRTHDDPSTPVASAISEIHDPGTRPDNIVDLPMCLS